MLGLIESGGGSVRNWLRVKALASTLVCTSSLKWQ